MGASSKLLPPAPALPGPNAPAAHAGPVEQALVPLVGALQAFYRAHARDLPWRRSRDAYQIWVSEIMLQQTRVDTVVPRYRAFLYRFPTVQALAAATAHEVCEAWAGLGYYRRARHLHAAARQVCRDFAGSLPATAAALRQIVGIGPYTAGAIASIAFAEAAPLVDGNVSRVFARLFAIDAPIDTPAGSKVFWALAARLVHIAAATGLPGDFNQALMELGATVCTPQRPRCAACPVQPFCQAYKEGTQATLPRKQGKLKVVPMQVSFVLCESAEGVLLEQRPLDGLWAGLWELPSAHGEDGPAQLVERGYSSLQLLAEVSHLLTHRRVTARIYRARPMLRQAAATPPTPAAGGGLRVWQDPLAAPLSTLARKAIVAARGAMVSARP